MLSPVHEQKIYVSVDSAARTSGTSSDFTFNLGTRALPSVKKVKLLSLSCPNTIYNIRTGVNDRFCFNRSGNFNPQIPPGYYTLSSLLTQLAASMNAVDGNGYIATSSATTGKITITGVSAFIVNFGTNPLAAQGCYQETGFVLGTDSGSSTTVTAPNVANLSLPYSIDIQIPQFMGANVITGNPAYTSTFTVPVNVVSGQLIQYGVNNEFCQEVNLPTPVTILEFHVKLLMNTGEVINLNGADWNMIFEFTVQNKYY